MDADDDWQVLRNLVFRRPPGEVEDANEIRSALMRCWDNIDGSDQQGMHPDDLNRMRNARWEPRNLTFEVERHSAMVAGRSGRAERQGWTVDLERKPVACANIGYRQVEPLAPRIDTNALAAEVAAVVEAKESDRRITLRPDGSVKVEIGQIIPDAGPKQTTAHRRKRFRTALLSLLAERGIEEHPRYVFRPVSHKQEA